MSVSKGPKQGLESSWRSEVADAINAIAGDDQEAKVNRSGDTMTGNLNLDDNQLIFSASTYPYVGNPSTEDELRLGVLNSADSTNDYLRIMGVDADGLRLIGAPTDLYIGNSATFDTASGEGIFFNGGGNRITLMHNGQDVANFQDVSQVYMPGFYAATSAATTNLLRVNGTGGAVQRSTSQARVKEGFEPIESPVDKLMALKPMWFRSKLPADIGRSFYGFTAEDSADVDPRFGAYDDDETDADGNPVPMEEMTPVGLDDRGILATAVATIQEQQRVIQHLEARITELENA